MPAPFYQSMPELAFSSVYAGKLFITLNGRWRDDSGDIIGRGGSSNVVICVQVHNQFSQIIAQSGVVDKFNAQAGLVMNYPGGGVVWNLYTVLMSSESTATGVVYQGLTPITLTAELRKR